MNAARALAATAAVVVVLAAAAFVAGVGPLGDRSGDDGGVPTATPTPTPAPDGGQSGGSGAGSGGGGGSDGGDGGDDAATPAPPPYAFTVTGIENCGRTCRDVTVELTNNRQAVANDVVVETSIYAGNSTDSGSRVWQGSEDVGEMRPGATTTETERVSLGFGAALSVQRNDGWITIRTTVRSADVTRTFTERRDVI